MSGSESVTVDCLFLSRRRVRPRPAHVCTTALVLKTGERFAGPLYPTLLSSARLLCGVALYSRLLPVSRVLLCCFRDRSFRFVKGHQAVKALNDLSPPEAAVGRGDAASVCEAAADCVREGFFFWSQERRRSSESVFVP